MTASSITSPAIAYFFIVRVFIILRATPPFKRDLQLQVPPLYATPTTAARMDIELNQNDSL
jgi:hypothetical protein